MENTNFFENPERNYREEILEIIRSEDSAELLSQKLFEYHDNDIAAAFEELSSEEMAELYTAFASHSILAVNADHTAEKAALQALISAKTAEILHGRLGHGDVDGDGEVTTADATLLLRYLADWQITLPHPDRADVDHDGAVTLRDAQKLLQYLAEFTGVTL
jgi:hypothetical protein